MSRSYQYYQTIIQGKQQEDRQKKLHTQKNGWFISLSHLYVLQKVSSNGKSKLLASITRFRAESLVNGLGEQREEVNQGGGGGRSGGATLAAEEKEEGEEQEEEEEVEAAANVRTVPSVTILTLRFHIWLHLPRHIGQDRVMANPPHS